MIRGIFSVVANRVNCRLSLASPANRNGTISFISKPFLSHQNAKFTSLTSAIINRSTILNQSVSKCSKVSLLEPQHILPGQTRTVTKFAFNKGKRKSVRTVRQRFFRLHWGIWIRTIAGRHKKLWKKSAARRNRISQHVFCNATQSRMLDKMVNKFWRKPKYYIEDPYALYHKRENFYITQTKPWRPEGVDYE